MKKNLILAASTALGCLASASAQTTVIDITGATAFRSAAMTAIRAAFNAGGPYAAIASNNVTSGTYQAFRGNFGTNPALANVIVRTSWNGSVEGIRAVATPNITVDGQNTSPLYIDIANITALTNAVNGNTVIVSNSSLAFARNTSEMAFSDVRRQATPVTGSVTQDSVGVVVFTMLANKSWRTDPRTAGITNITSQQFRVLMAQGRAPLSLFTGNNSDTEFVYATGRNDGSGTRTTYLAETGYGISTPVVQYTGHDRTLTTELPSIQLVPPGGGFLANRTATPGNQSTVWGQNINGNGGYSSGSELAGDFAKLTDNTTVYQYVASNDGNAGDLTFADREEFQAAEKLFLITWLTAADARTALGGYNASGFNSTVGNAVILGYEGVRLDTLATFGGNSTSPLPPEDRAKVTSGRYTAWSNQQLLRVTGNTTLTAANAVLKGNLNSASIIGTAGIPTGELTANGVSRVEDGGIVTRE